jgi:hypothetical protein
MNMWAALELSCCGVLPLLAGPGLGGGGLDVSLFERAIAANTHPITVPVNSASWAPNNTRVVNWIPINTGSLLCRRKECLPTSVIELASEGARKVPEGEGASLTGP